MGASGLGLVNHTVDVWPTGNTTYIARGTHSATGCWAEANFDVVIKPQPALPVISSLSSVCLGDTLELIASGSGSDAIYKWDHESAPSATTEVRPAGNTTYTVTATNSYGCSVVNTKDITTKALPTVTEFKDNHVICIGKTAILSVEGDNIVSYLWSNGKTSKNTTITPDTSQHYWVEVRNSLGCTLRDSGFIDVHNPKVNIVGDEFFCLGESISLTAMGTPVFQWNTGATTSIITPTPTGNATYAVVGTDAAGCSVSAKIDVKLKPAPTPVISGAGEICYGETTVLTAVASNASTYFWTHDPYFDSNTASVTPTSDTDYTVTVTGVNGCVASKTAKVKVNSRPVITKYLADTAVCKDNNIRLSIDAADANGGGLKYRWSTGHVSKDVLLSPTVAQTYSVEISNSKNCTVRDSAFVDLLQLPVVDIAGATLVCLGKNTVLSAAGADIYEWNTGETLSDITVAPTKNATYTVIGTDHAGCSSSAKINVTVKPGPAPVIIGDSEICYGEESLLTAVADNSNTYLWSHDPYFNSNTTLVAPTADTDYTVTVIDTDGCVASKTARVKVNSIPVITKYLVDTAVCKDNNIRLSIDAADPNGGGLKYRWSTGHASKDVLLSPTVAQTYSVEISNSKNCTVRDSAFVDLLQLPVVDIAGATLVCLGKNTVLSAAGADIYEWNTGETLADITVAPVKNATYTVRGTDHAGCSSSAKIDVKVKPGPAPVIIGDSEICYGEESLLTAVADNGNTYYWSHDPYFNSNTTLVAPTADANYTVTVTDTDGCSATKTAQVKVNSLPVITKHVVDTTVCYNTPLRLDVEASGTVTYLWNTGQQSKSVNILPLTAQYYSVEVSSTKNCKVRDSGYVSVLKPEVAIAGDSLLCLGDSLLLSASGAIVYEWNTGATLSDILVSPTGKATYTVKGIDNSGCIATASINVKIKPDPIPVISGNTLICAGDTITLTVSSGGDGSSYVWKHQPLRESNTATVSPTSDTEYTVTVKGINGCSVDKTVLVAVNSLPALTASNDTAVCAGTRITMNANAIGTGVSYLWSTGDRTNRIELQPVENQSLWIEATDLKNCKTRKEITVEALPLPTLQIYGKSDICEGESLELTVVGADKYQWSTGSDSSVLAEAIDKNKRYQVVGIDNNGCRSKTQTIDVVVHRPPVASIKTNKTTINEKESEVHFEAVVNDNNCVVDWDFGDGNWASNRSMSYIYNVGQRDSLYNVTLVATNDYGCTDTTYKLVYVAPFIPNTFTTDGDGVNDMFMDDCLSCKNIKIYDRMGISMYEGSAGWDGKYKGRTVDDDTYYYVITLKTKILDSDIRKGFVTVTKKSK